MRRGLTLVEVAVALVVLGIAAAFLLEPFRQVLLGNQEVEDLRMVLAQAQTVVERYRAGLETPTCTRLPLEGTPYEYQACLELGTPTLNRLVVRFYREDQLVTAVATLQPGSLPSNTPPVLEGVTIRYSQRQLILTFSEPVGVPIGSVALRQRVRRCLFLIFPICQLSENSLGLSGLPTSGQQVVLQATSPLPRDSFWFPIGFDYTYFVHVVDAITDQGTPPLPLENPGTWTCTADMGDPEVCQP